MQSLKNVLIRIFFSKNELFSNGYCVSLLEFSHDIQTNMKDATSFRLIVGNFRKPSSNSKNITVHFNSKKFLLENVSETDFRDGWTDSINNLDEFNFFDPVRDSVVMRSELSINRFQDSSLIRSSKSFSTGGLIFFKNEQGWASLDSKGNLKKMEMPNDCDYVFDEWLIHHRRGSYLA